MEKKVLYDFVKKFNKSKGITNDTILDGLKTLPKEDHELFMMLVNYKNGNAFKQFIQTPGDKK